MAKRLKDLVKVEIPTLPVGAYTRPSWFTYNFRGADVKEALMDANVREMYQDAVKSILKDQELAGLDMVSDGAMRYDTWLGGWGGIAHIAGRLGGVKWTKEKSAIAKSVVQGKPPRILLESFWEQVQYGLVEEKITGDRLQQADFYSAVGNLSDKPMKFTMSDACLTMFALANKYYKDEAELYFELCKLYNKELKSLSDDGCKIIQLDWALAPAHVLGKQANKEMWDTFVEGLNIEVKGVKAQVWIHNCWGRPQNQFAAGGPLSYEEYFKHVGETDIDAVEIEAASTNGDNLKNELSVWKDYSSDKTVIIGAVNHRTTVVESSESVANIIEKAAKITGPDKLGVTSDCGFPSLPRTVAFYKLMALAEGAKIARQRLK